MRFKQLGGAFSFFLLGSIILTPEANAQFPYFRTIAKSGGAGNQQALAVRAGLDFMTNAYIFGTFDTEIAVGSTLTNPSPCTNIFVAKYHFGGFSTSPAVPAWAVAPVIDQPLSNLRFAVHPSGGALVAGDLTGTNITMGSFQITNATPGAASDVFLGKYDGSGNPLWLQRLGGSSSENCGDLVTDNSGNNFLAGSFESTTFTAGATNLIKQSATGTDSFLLKLDSNGSVVWAKQGSYSSAQRVALDQLGNSYLSGTASGSASISGMTPTNPTSGQFFIKHNSSGTPLWCRGDMKIGDTLAIDRAQNIVSAGSFTGVAQFQNLSLSNNAPASAFIVKYNSAGDVLWTRHIPGGGNDRVNALYVDSRTNYWITGSFAPSNEETNGRMFVACFDFTGDLMGFDKASGGVSSGNGLTTFMGGFDYVCGTFTGEFKIGKHSLTNNGDSELMLARLVPLPPRIKTTVNGNKLIHSWPRPSSIGFDASENFSFKVSDNLGGWTASTNTPALISGQYYVTNDISPAVQFYRLEKP